MILLGLLLMAATAAFTGLVIADNFSGGPSYSVTILGNHIATLNMLAIFCAGLALALIFGLGFMMMSGGGALAHRRHRKLRHARAERDRVADERDAVAQHAQAQPAQPAQPAARTRTGDATAPLVGSGSSFSQSATAQKGRRRHSLHLFGH
ncbi:hypothetical protein [Phaeacidiphilus oryzae]|uniref:hypothetical protein n=1 Tax=Phaeacidiphilus oryzae TaxID=348818 RepID=UPI001269B25D|nr:hypothetical protein [Phaeacidiphilus oryzae]